MILRHSAWAAASAIVLAVSRFGFLAIVARRLASEEFGQYAFAQWMVDLAFLGCSLGATGAASRYIAESRTHPQELAAFMNRWRSFALGLPWAAGAAVVIGVLLSGMDLTLFETGILSLWAVANGLWAMQTSALIGMQRFDLVFLANLIAASIMVGGALWIPIGEGAIGSLFGLMAAACVCAGIVGLSRTFAKDRSAGEIEPTQWRMIRRYAANIWLTTLLWSLVWSRGELPIVREYLGDAGVAHYAVALALFGGAIQGVMLGLSGVAQQLTRVWGEGRPLEAVTLARNVMDLQLLFCGIASLVLICMGQELIHFLFGRDYLGAASTLALLALGLLALAVSCQNHLLQLATDAKYNRDVTLIGLFVLFASAFLLIPRLGLNGAATARSGTMIFLATVSWVITARRWGKDSVSTRNGGVVIVMIAIAIAGVVSGVLTSITSRLAMLAAALCFLAVAMVDRRGNYVVVVLPKLLVSRFSTTALAQRIRNSYSR